MTCGREPHLRAPGYRTRTFSLYISVSTTYPADRDVQVKRLQLGGTAGALVPTPKRELFLQGPIPLKWLGVAAKLPGKTINVAIALWWLHRMAKGKPFKLTQTSLKYLDVKRDAASAALARLELAGLIQVERRPGQRPNISMVDRAPRSGSK